MNNERVRIEDQLRRYADAVDPAANFVIEPPVDRVAQRRISSKLGWRVVTAAAVLVIVVGAFVARGSDVDQVQTAGAADREIPAPIDLPFPLPSQEDVLAVSLASFALMDECMVAKDRPLPMPLVEESVLHVGSWSPHGVLGIRGEVAARVLGYQDSGWNGLGSPSQGAAWRLMTIDEQEELGSALQSCHVTIDAALGIESPRLVVDGDETQGERFRSDSVLEAAIEQWQVCVKETVGVEADTPNTLARQFAFGSSETSPREVEIAVADVRCQRTANLEEAFYRAEATQLLTELEGEERRSYEEQMFAWAETVERAEQVLAERGIVPPSLD